MSDQLPYRTRLLWDGRAGLARLNGQQVKLWDAPALGAEPLHAVDFIPDIGLAEIQPRPCDARRAMTGEEVAAARVLLDDLCSAPVAKPMISPMLDVPSSQ